MYFKNPKSETKYPKFGVPKDAILGYSLKSYHHPIQDNLNIKGYCQSVLSYVIVKYNSTTQT